MKITKSQLRKIISEEIKDLSEVVPPIPRAQWTTRGQHDKRPPSEPAYNAATEGYIIDEFESLRKRVKELEKALAALNKLWPKQPDQEETGDI